MSRFAPAVATALLLLVPTLSPTGAADLAAQEGDAARPAEEAGQGPGRAYPDGHGGEVFFPLGDASFADSVVEYRVGDPPPSSEGDRVASEALGIPDFANDDHFLTLGCEGTVVLAFEDNVLLDVPGPDLHVFEIGPDVEPTDLAISEDGEEWIDIGDISGGRADVDIAGRVEPGAFFSYVRLTDRGSACSGTRTPGADIDAVGAIGAGQRIVLEAGVLFGSGEAVVRDSARAAVSGLGERLRELDPVRIVVEGHTDAVGSADDNLALSRRRAEAVLAVLRETVELTDVETVVRALGEGRPVATNDTEEGRARNRRVEIVVVPGSGTGGG